MAIEWHSLGGVVGYKSKDFSEQRYTISISGMSASKNLRQA